MKWLLGWLLIFSIFSTNAANYNPKRLLVKTKNSELLKSLKNQNRVQHLFENWFVLHTDNLSELEREVSSLKTPIIFERDYKGTKGKLPIPQAVPNDKEEVSSVQFNDPRASRVWSLRDSWRHGTSVEKAYGANFTSASQQIIVAVVDTGIDFNHEDLKENMWVNTNEIPGNGIDDDKNGYIDDVHGINTLIRDSNGNATGDMDDTHSHGTHVAGTSGAVQNNGIGMPGIASNVKLMGIRTVPNSGDELDVDVVEAFLYAAKNGAKIINCSFGKDNNEGGQAVKEAIDFIGKEYGTLVVAAAGNSGRDIDSRLTYPASFDSANLMVVASTTSRGRLSYFSNYGDVNVDLAAPGSSVYSTTPGDGYGNMSGTSMASPTAAGIAAEVWSRHPSLSPVELKAVLMKTVTKTRRLNKPMAARGRIDLYEALSSLEN